MVINIRSYISNVNKVYFKENIKSNILKLNNYVLTYFKHLYQTRNEKYVRTNIIQPTFLKQVINYHLGLPTYLKISTREEQL